MIKKSFLTVASFFVLTFALKAQIGVRAGLNLSSTKVEFAGLNVDTDSKVGFHLGVVNDFKFTDNLTFRPGVLFSIKGGKAEDESTNYSYVEVPLSLIYNFTGSESGFFAEAGPYLGLLLAAKSGDVDVKEGLNTLDFGLNIGLGYDLGTFIVGANYGLGLANIVKTEEDVDLDVTAKNNNIAIYGIYQF
jgi:hypothetical protein